MAGKLRVFKSRMGACNYVFADGNFAAFVGGKFYTDNATYIAELEAEVAAKHPVIYIDPAESEIDAVMVDPATAQRINIVAEYLAQQTGKPLDLVKADLIAEESGDAPNAAQIKERLASIAMSSSQVAKAK